MASLLEYKPNWLFKIAKLPSFVVDQWHGVEQGSGFWAGRVCKEVYHSQNSSQFLSVTPPQKSSCYEYLGSFLIQICWNNNKSTTYITCSLDSLPKIYFHDASQQAEETSPPAFCSLGRHFAQRTLHVPQPLFPRSSGPRQLEHELHDQIFLVLQDLPLLAPIHEVLWWCQ